MVCFQTSTGTETTSVSLPKFLSERSAATLNNASKPPSSFRVISNEFFEGGLVGDIEASGDGVFPGGPDLICDSLRGGLIEIRRHHLHTFLGKA
jgi:hypothetical protein